MVHSTLIQAKFDTIDKLYYVVITNYELIAKPVLEIALPVIRAYPLCEATLSGKLLRLPVI